MKKIFLFFPALVLFLTFSCENHLPKEPGNVKNDTIKDPQYYINKTIDSPTSAAPADTSCIDPAKADPNAVCTEQYDPVCGCDGKTYSNPCIAEKAGIKKTTKGECK